MTCDPFWRILQQPNCFRKIRRSSRPVMMPPVAAICPVRWTLHRDQSPSLVVYPCRARGLKASRRVRQNFRTMHLSRCVANQRPGTGREQGKRDRSSLGRFRERQEVPVPGSLRRRQTSVLSARGARLRRRRGARRGGPLARSRSGSPGRSATFGPEAARRRARRSPARSAKTTQRARREG